VAFKIEKNKLSYTYENGKSLKKEYWKYLKVKYQGIEKLNYSVI